MSSPPLTTWIEDDRVYVPVGKAHGVHCGSEFVSTSDPINCVFAVHETEAFRSSARLEPHILQLLKENQTHVRSSRWNLGNQTLRISFNENAGDILRHYVILSLRNRISSTVEGAVVSQSSKRHADSLAVERQIDGSFRIDKPSQLEGYEGLAQNLGISGDTLKATAEELSDQLSHIARFRQVLALKNQASSAPKPFNVDIGVLNGTAVDRVHPYSQQFTFNFQNECDEDLFLTILSFGPGFSIRQGVPEVGLSEKVRPGERLKFPLMMNMMKELQLSTMLNERRVHRDIVRILVVKGGEVSWKSLEQPNIWNLSHAAKGTPSGDSSSYDASNLPTMTCDWWVVDKEILTLTNGLDRLGNGPQRHAQYNLCGSLDQAKQQFRLGYHQYLSFSRTGNFDDIDGAIHRIQSAISKTSDESGKDLMRVALGEIGSNLGLPSIGAAPLEYLKKAVGATKATGLAGSHRGKLLNQLGSLLNGIFARTRDQTTFEEAMQVTKDAVSATVGDTTEHATALINVCNRLSERYDQTGSVSDLDKAIDFAQEAMQETLQMDEFEAIQTSIAGNLALTLLKRFSISKRNEDLEDSLNFNAIALDGVSLSDPNRPLWQNNMGMALGERYSVSQDINDLEDSIRLTEESLQVINPMHVARKGIIFNLAIRLRDRFLSIGSREDLDRAISLFRQVQIPDNAHMTSEQKIERSRRLTLLGVSLGDRSDLTKEVVDIEQSVEALREAFSALPSDNLDREVRMSNLATALRRRFLLQGDIGDLNEAISLRKESLKDDSENNCVLLRQSEDLGTELNLRFGKSKSRDDIDEAIRLMRRSVLSAFQVQSDTADRLVRLAVCLHTRFERYGQMADLDEATDIARKAVTTAKGLSHSRLNALRELCVCLMERSSQIGDEGARDECIHLAKEALQEPDIDLPNRQLFMSYLATCFEHRFSNTSDLSDLNELIDFNREAMKLLPEDGDSNFRQLGNLSGALRNRFNRIGQMVDLDEAIQATREMLTKIPTQESDNRVAAMVNLAGHLVLKFFRTKNIEDLNQAISLSHQTISIDHSNRFLRLNNCGSQLLERFRHTRQISDLNESIALLREATLGKKDHHPNFLDLLTNLAFALEQRHRQFHEMGDLDEAVHLGRQSAQETSDDHPMKATRLFQFGLDIQHKYVHSKRPDDLHEAKEAFLDGLNNEKGDVTIRIAAGREFLKLCDINNDGQRAFSVAETIVNLIPLTASLSQRPSDKQYFLSQVAGSASDAAAIALHVGKRPASVIQLLETGRGVIAGTLQDLRVDVTVLEKSDADLANRFVKLRNTLDTPRNPVAKQTSLSIEDHIIPLDDQEFEADKRHNASMQLSSILDEIRRVSGFETFLLAGTDDQMTEAAANGHIIIINVSSYRCDALVIGHRFVQALELPNLKLEDIISRSNTLDSIDTLEWLWDVAIGPVLDLLGFTRTPAEGNAWPHVWWIPTGPLVRFPLHAAGHHLRGTHEAALDRVVSSYSVSVKAITNTRKQHLARGDGSECGLDAILVSMPETPGQGSLQYAKSEIDEVEKLCSAMGLTCTQPEANQHDVLTALDRCRVFHFAGHGGTHPTDPLSSLLLLKDYQTRPLTVGSLLDKNLQSKRPFLAYLSACGTGQIKDTTSVDESIHLTSAFQLAGFRHVVGTLWSVDDEVCLDVARATYEAIREHGFEDSSVSLGLHQGLRSLRDKWVASQKDPVGSERDIAVLSVSVKDRRLLWVPYVHFGV